MQVGYRLAIVIFLGKKHWIADKMAQNIILVKIDDRYLREPVKNVLADFVR